MSDGTVGKLQTCKHKNVNTVESVLRNTNYAWSPFSNGLFWNKVYSGAVYIHSTGSVKNF